MNRGDLPCPTRGGALCRFNVSVFDRKNGVNKTFFYVPGQCNPMQNGMPWTGDV